MADSSVRDPVAGYAHGQVPRKVREGQLLTLAEELFLEHGYAAASIVELAARAGVSRPVVYEHFGSKDGLCLAVADRIRGELDDALRAIAARTSDAEALLREGQTAFLRLLERDPRRWWLVYGGGTHGGALADGLAQLREETVALLAELLQPYVPGADPRDVLLLGHAISGAGEQLGRYWLRHRDVPLETVIEGYVRSLMPGVRALEAGGPAMDDTPASWVQ